MEDAKIGPDLSLWPTVKRVQNKRCHTTEEFPLFFPKAEWVGRRGTHSWGPFLESARNVSDPKSSIQIKSKENKRRS